MEITELRIGNLVLDEDGVPMYVGAIMPIGKIPYVKDSAGNNVAIDDLKPIELTPEILVKCGFIKFEKEFYNDNICFEYFNDDLRYSAGEGLGLSIAINYLHQLQNLYYALTGKELEVKL